MIARDAAPGRQDTAKCTPKQRYGFRSAHLSLQTYLEPDEAVPTKCATATASDRIRTEKVTLQRSAAWPNARKRKPQGKWRWAGNTADESGGACLGGCGNASAGGRQARPVMTRVKSGKKKLFPMGEHAQQRIFHLQGLPCSRKS
jgi:hypothetical protein